MSRFIRPSQNNNVSLVNPSSAVQKLARRNFNSYDKNQADFRHYIFNHFWFIGEQNLQPLKQHF